MIPSGPGHASRRCAQVVALLVAFSMFLVEMPAAEVLWTAITTPGSAGRAKGLSMTVGQTPTALATPSTSTNVVVSWASSTSGPVPATGSRPTTPPPG